MGKESHLGIQWTTALLGKKSMDVKIRNAGAFGHYEDIQPLPEMRHWLYKHTDGIQHSRITASQWWWDITEDGKAVKFYFRDPSVAIKFKLTWGGYVVSDNLG